MAVSDASRHAIWLQQMWSQLGLERPSPTIIYVDNQGAIDLTKNAVHHKRSKHIDIKYHFIRDCVANGIVEIPHVASEDNIADVLTKPLSYEMHSDFSGSFGLIS